MSLGPVVTFVRKYPLQTKTFFTQKPSFASYIYHRDLGLRVGVFWQLHASINYKDKLYRHWSGCLAVFIEEKYVCTFFGGFFNPWNGRFSKGKSLGSSERPFLAAFGFLSESPAETFSKKKNQPKRSTPNTLFPHIKSEVRHRWWLWCDVWSAWPSCPPSSGSGLGPRCPCAAAPAPTTPHQQMTSGSLHRTTPLKYCGLTIKPTSKRNWKSEEV